MSGYFKFRLILALIAIPVFFIVYAMRKSDDGEQFRKAAHQIVAHIDGYEAKKDYIDGLVDYAHDQVFDSTFHYSPGGRFSRGRSWVDGDKYIHDLFRSMEEQAVADHQTGIAESMRKYVREQIDGVEERPRDATTPKTKGR